ncbi:MAG: hypothetical protein IT295_10265 [Dehalococcoidia bacterium]|nr:hypothetical protein [Dehalococcoidia bacterium]
MSDRSTVEVRCPKCGRFVLEGLFETLRVRHCGGYFIAQAQPGGMLLIQSADTGLRTVARPA